MDRKANTIVPPHLIPSEFGGYAPALSFYKEGDITISLTSSTIVVDGETFTYTGNKSLSLLAAEIRRALPSIDVRPLMKVAPEASSLLKYNNDLTPDGGTIIRYMGLNTKPTERTRIRLLKPHPDGPSAPWWPRINKGSFRTSYQGVTYTFSIPEFWLQNWSLKFGAPYKDYGGVEVDIIDEQILQLPRYPILWPGPMTIYRNGKELQHSIIEDVSAHNGKVYLSSPMDLTDHIVVDYTYEETEYVYKGVNLNPTLQHSPYLVDRFVLFYLIPERSNAGLINSSCVRHVVGDTLEGAISQLSKGTSSKVPSVLLGAIRTRQVENAKDVSVYDARRPGGGVKKKIDATKRADEAWFYSDIGNYDGRPYPGNAVVIVKLPSNIKTIFSEDEVQGIIRNHLALGIAPVIDYN